MEIRKILEADVRDIIFEQKNKTYGAYELRKNYHKRAKKAMMAMVLFGALVSSIPLVAGLLTGKEDVYKRQVSGCESIFKPTINEIEPIR